MSALVVIPHGAADGAERVRARDWVAARYESLHGLPVTFAPCPTPEWSKGAAANPVVAASDADLIVLADADSYVSADALTRAVDHADAHGWGMPHSVVRRLSRQSTEVILAGGDAVKLERAAYPALPGGGIVVLTREAWETVNGMDPRFVGWGGEDAAFGLALSVLVGPVNPRRVSPLLHLWHPPAANCRKPSQHNRDVDAKYKACRRDPSRMADLVREW